jgi:hypothetical protein
MSCKKLHLAKTAIEIAIEDNCDAITDPSLFTPIYYESPSVQPLPTLDNIEYTPQTLYGGMTQKDFIEENARYEGLEITTPLPSLTTFEDSYIHRLLQICFLKEEEVDTDVDTVTDIYKYTPSTNYTKKATLKLTEQREQIVIKNACGTFSIETDTKSRVMIKFKIYGLFVSQTQKTELEDNYVLAIPEVPKYVVLNSSKIKIDNTEIDTDSINFDKADNIAFIGTHGLNSGFYQTDFRPKLSLTGYRDDKEFNSKIEELISGEKASIEIIFSDSTKKDIYKIMGLIKHDSVTKSESEGRLKLSKEFVLMPITGDDNFSLEVIL